MDAVQKSRTVRRPLPTPHQPRRAHANRGFCRPDLIATLACLIVLAGLAWPWVARSGVARQTMGCVENLHQLMTAWSLYANDSNGRVVNNFTITETFATVSDKSFQNWTHNVLDWTTNPFNTNLTFLGASRLFPYLTDNAAAFKCPDDTYLSPSQRSRGWVARVRSYSMNGFMGLTGPGANESTRRGENRLYPGYRQFLQTSAIPDPGRTLVFLDEHPDSINDGYLIETPTSSSQWLDIPGSQHDGGAGVAFADGSAEIHLWAFKSTKLPVRYSGFFATAIPSAERGDYNWLLQRLTVAPSTLGVRPAENGQLKITWSQYPTSYVLQSSPTAGAGGTDWTDVKEPTVRSGGTSEVATELQDEHRFYRVISR